MTSSIGPRWSQPAPPRTDENLKHVHRKMDRNLKSDPLVDNAPLVDRESRRMSLPGAPSLMARVVQLAAPAAGEAVAPARSAVAEPGAAPALEDEDVLAKAWAERMAKQWEDVTARLLRDFAPNGGAEADAVLRHIAEQRKELDSATVRDYLPVLVDKAVRRLLDPEGTASRG